MVNCASTKCCVWPDIDRHRRGCARGNGGGNAECGIGARWDARVRRCGSVGAVGSGACPALRFCWGDCVRFTPVFFPLSGKKRRLAVACVPIPPGRDRHSCILAVLARLSALAGSLWDCVFLYGDLDGLPGNGRRGWRRGFCALLRGRIGFDMFSAGSTLGLRAPDCAKESSTLWTLFTLRRGYVDANSRPLCVFTRSHWLCGVFRGEYAGAKCGSRTAAAPDCAKESNVEAALPHLWTLLTLRRGCVGANTRRLCVFAQAHWL